MIGVIVGIVVLVFIFIAFLIAYRRKSTESNRVLKNMQEQMDILELRVAAECKEGMFVFQTYFIQYLCGQKYFFLNNHIVHTN